MTSPFDRAGAELVIDLGAVVANWRTLAERARPARCAVTIKADAYGLGAEPVGRALAEAGCAEFFVATLDEGIALRRELGPSPAIYVLTGPLPGSEGEFEAVGLTPVLNTVEQIRAWRGRTGPAALHLDTGMNRLGLPRRDLDRALKHLARVRLVLVLSHLARAEEEGEAMNAAQRDEFMALRPRFPAVPASLANSSGIFLGPGYHLDLVRPGYAIYGGNPLPGRTSPMRQVIELKARIVQVRAVDRGESVGYGASHRPTGPARIATVPIGYADGYRRSLGGRGRAYVEGIPVPVVGRVSMDLLTLDVSSLPDRFARAGTAVELIGPNATVDALADAAGTIGYEILTGLGSRVPRRYVRSPAER